MPKKSNIHLLGYSWNLIDPQT